MTRRDYEALAAAIKRARQALPPIVAGSDEPAHVALDNLVREIADYCAHDNPRFDVRRFYHECKTKQYITGVRS